MRSGQYIHSTWNSTNSSVVLVPSAFLLEWNPNVCLVNTDYGIKEDWNCVFLGTQKLRFLCQIFLLNFLLYYSIFYFYPNNSQSSFSANFILLASFPNLIKTKFVTLSSLKYLPICSKHKNGGQQEGSWVKKPGDLSMIQSTIIITKFSVEKKKERNQ